MILIPKDEPIKLAPMGRILTYIRHTVDKYGLADFEIEIFKETVPLRVHDTTLKDAITYRKPDLLHVRYQVDSALKVIENLES